MVARRGGYGRRRPAHHPLELAGGHRVQRGGRLLGGAARGDRLRDRRRVPDRGGRPLGAGARELVRLLPVLALATAGVPPDPLARPARNPGGPPRPGGARARALVRTEGEGDQGGKPRSADDSTGPTRRAASRWGSSIS